MHVFERKNFHKSRWRCLWNPTRARDVLKPYAILHIRVQAAQNLLAKDVGLTRHSSDPYYEISLDDKTHHVSEPVMDSLNPVFNHPSLVLPIWHPMSVVCVKLMDWENAMKRMSAGNDILGFVEFQIKDLPMNEDALGWFELRLEDYLVGTADKRVAEHRAIRDDMDYERPEQASVIHTKKRHMGAMCGCAPALPGALRISQRVANAGNVLIELHLEVQRPFDEYFAHALPAPVFKQHLKSVVAKKHQLPELNVGELIENTTYIGDTLWKNGALCILDSIWYILTWQECWISLLFTIGWVCMILFPNLAPAIFVLSIAFWLVILGSSKRRARMVANPASAPLDDEGLALVALLQSTQKMTIWIERIILQILRGVINSHSDLELFAGSVFRNGKPLMNFNQVVSRLRREKVIVDPFETSVEMQQQKPEWLTLPTHTYAPKTKVLVKQFARAQVKGSIVSVHENETYTIRLEEGSTLKGISEADLSFDDAGNNVVANIPTWLIADAVEDSIREIQPVVGGVRQQIGGAWSALHSLLTWKNARANCCIVVVLLVLAAVLAFFGCYLYQISLYVSMAITILIVLFIMCFFSWWFQIFVNILSATSAYCKHRKKPKQGDLNLAYFTNYYDRDYGDQTTLLSKNNRQGYPTRIDQVGTAY